MLECLILGDSIAVGTKMAAPTECVSYSVSGLNTSQWNRRYGNTPIEADTVVISLGTNDHSGVNTYDELMKLRRRVRATRVVWIMPPCNAKFCKSNINEIIRDISLRYEDEMIATSFVSRDNIHPTWRGYRDLVVKARINF